MLNYSPVHNYSTLLEIIFYFINDKFRVVKASTVVSDNVKGIEDILLYLHKMGHHDIAYIHGADSSVTRSRLASFYKSMEDLGLEVKEEYIY